MTANRLKDCQAPMPSQTRVALRIDGRSLTVDRMLYTNFFAK